MLSNSKSVYIVLKLKNINLSSILRYAFDDISTSTVPEKLPQVLTQEDIKQLRPGHFLLYN
jgi:hypothetical protein